MQYHDDKCSHGKYKFFQDMLAEEASFTPSHCPKHVTFMDTMGGDVTSSIPHRYQEEVILPSRPTEMNHPEEIEFQAAAHKFRKMCEPKISKLKGGYSLSAGLSFQSWLKDICVHIEDRKLTQREVMTSPQNVPSMRWSFIWAWLPKKISPSKAS